MNCDKADILISRYVTGELDEAEGKVLQSHLASCAACRELTAELQALEFLLDGLSDIRQEPPPFLANRIIARLPERTAQPWWSWKTMHPYVAAASMVLALAIGFFMRDVFLKSGTALPGNQMVRVIFYSPEASSVALVGDFNEWGQREVTLAHTKDQGVWEFSLDLRPGVYHYNLLVDGQRWASNPKSSSLVPDGFGGYDSVLVVSEKCLEDCT